MIRVYGSNDDLIEIEGDIREEFCNPRFSDEPHYVLTSTGSILKVYMGIGGRWRTTVEYRVYDDIVREFIANQGEGDMGLQVEGDIKWVAVVPESSIKVAM